ncbi:fructan beta-fructosidase [Algoriphagus boseongensis]|uniref:Fructan beta-fructosidase n=1 Tax=Algoriphagus boseongensis TaxID=1442587 RepID=A0A4R6TAX7_9BACT|nr:glycoside hydrolase family 32 protein [Algoriphagus boseongensis]TDQ19132.1 fructan beta-fructosidase [Algoriphagus boseongensis]
MKYFYTILFFSLTLLLFSCKKSEVPVFQESELETYRPEYHFTPKKGWINDPNGMIFIDGEYHLFFQYYPDSTVWGPMHWGHAVSTDLVNWEEKPIGLYPDSLGYIFSGSAVYDGENTSGLGSSENPPLIAIFTYHDMEGEKSGKTDYQSQGIAFSLDKGKTWTKYAGNPVLPNQGIKDFRDPKVRQIIHPDGQKSWIMTLAVMDRIQFFESPDLKNWKLLSEFGQDVGAHGGVWECPDLLEMTAPDGTKKWVLLVSINPGGPQKGSATQYFIGNFAEGKFTPDDTMIRWLDYGPDNYAGVTWSNLPSSQNRTLFIGWMSNWLYAQVVPTKSWRSAMTLPRELSLIDINGTLLLQSKPAKELENLRKEEYSISNEEYPLPSQAFELIAEVEDEFTLEFSNELGEKLILSKEFGLVSIDRTRAGKSTFHEDFAAVHSSPMSWEARTIRVFIDASSIELFVNESEITMTSLLFPGSPWKTVSLSKGLEDVRVFSLKK